MSRIVGKWLGTIEIDFEEPCEELDRPLSEIKSDFINGAVTTFIKETLEEESDGKVTVTQQYADFYEVDDNKDD